LGALIAFTLLFFLNFYKVETTTNPVTIITINATAINQFQASNPVPQQPLFQVFSFVLNLVSFVLVIVTIFWYKNRIQQNLLTRLVILLNSGLLVVLLLSADKLKAMVVSTSFTSGYQAGIALPFISLVLLFLAGKAIMKDEKLVRSADRIR
jgi:hypothetical protein